MASRRPDPDELGRLARRLNVPVQRLQAVLRDLGHEAEARGALPVSRALVERLETALEAPLTRAGAEPVDDLMRQIGVRPLPGRGRGARAPSPARDPDVQAALTRAIQRADDAELRLAAARRERDRAREELREAREEARTSRARAEADLADLQARVDALEAENAELRDLRASGGVPWPELLASVGVEGPSEELEAMASLVATRRWLEVASHLRAPEPHRLRRLLEAGLLPWCGRPACPEPPSTVARVQVPPARCRVCGGRDPRAAMEGLVDALLLRGRRRLTLLGGQAPLRGVLAELADPRLRIDLQPLVERRLAERCEGLAARGEVVVAWGREELPPVRPGIYHQREVVAVRAASLVEAIEGARAAIEALAPT